MSEPFARCNICNKPLSKGETGATCLSHVGKIRLFSTSAAQPPEGWIRMSKVCRAFEAQGFTTAQIVNACGKDACTEPTIHPLFNVVYVGRSKWLHPDVVTQGPEILRAALKAKTPEKPAPKVSDEVAAANAEIAATLARSPNAGVSNGKKVNRK